MSFYKVVKINAGNNDSNTLSYSQLNLFKGDYGLDIGFELVHMPYKEKLNDNISSVFTNAYVDAVILKPNKTKTIIKNLKVSNNIIVLKITKELIDQIGVYYIQFHIGNAADDADTSYFAIPGIKINVDKPIGYTESEVEEVTLLSDSEGNVICDETGEYVICI